MNSCCRLGWTGCTAAVPSTLKSTSGLDAFITHQRDPACELLRFPPVMSRQQLERSGYLKSFPNLLGCVAALHGSEASIRAAADVHEQGGEWTRALAASDLVLSPAACYPLYPLAARRGPVPLAGLLFDVAAECFRHEPARTASRQQSFRMRELVCIDTAARALAFRDAWIPRARTLAEQLGLPCAIEPATDPFFGRVGQVMAVSQRQQALKFELLIRLQSDGGPTACMSFNYHLDHFGSVWEIGRRAEDWHTPHASPSVWTAWCWRCSACTDSTHGTGRRRCGRPWGSLNDQLALSEPYSAMYGSLYTLLRMLIDDL